MSELILKLALQTERDVVQARQRARELADALGFDNQEQIRLATATSEIARNSFRYAQEGWVSFAILLELPQRFEITVTDAGPGIPHLDDVLDGQYKSTTGMGMGIVGTKRLMDHFQISSSPSGTTVQMSKRLPRHALLLTRSSARELLQKIQERPPENPYEEIQRQNQEILNTLQSLRTRQEELELLNRELEDTNRGVVALYAELDERADYLRRASDLKTKFLSNVSHEFRTPLNSIISLSRMLMDKIDGELSSEQEKQVRYIESSATDLQELVNDLLDLAKVEAGKIKIRPKTFEVAELFSALKGMLKPLLADNSSVDLIFEDAQDVPPLHTDGGKVSQILRNLISNALKFTPDGQVTVSAAAVDNGSVLFKVADTGIGIPLEHHQTVFKEFSQVENPLQERHRGTGLGLPLCRNLAMLLGGRLWLESQPGEGSTFFAEIPIVYTGEASAAGTPQENVPVPEFHRAPILLLEDNPKTAAVLESYLRNSEFQAIVVNDVVQAESWIERHAPVAAMCDIYLDGEPVWGFVANLRNRFPDLPLILTSVYEEERTALAKGATKFLPKPVERDTLLRELRRLTAVGGMRRLLIVDDNEVSRYIVRELLDRPWLTIGEANNGLEALKLMRDNIPDALILDLLMPDMSGFEVLRHLRAQTETISLPVLIYTSKPLSESEKSELETLRATIVRKEDVSTRLSAQPFLDWLKSEGLSLEAETSEQNV